MNNYFQGNSKHPVHLSVGGVVLNEKGEVLAHYFDSERSLFRGYWKDQGFDKFYILMRETVEPGETLETALHRGLMEEFGVEAEIEDFLGSIKSGFDNNGVRVEKTTLYFLCKLKSQDLGKRKEGDVEAQSELRWLSPEFLIPIMKEQTRIYGRTDVDDSAILEKIG